MNQRDLERGVVVALQRTVAEQAAELLRLREALRDISASACHCTFVGPCGCGERMKETASAALAGEEP